LCEIKNLLCRCHGVDSRLCALCETFAYLAGKGIPQSAKDTQSPQSETPPYLSTDPEIILKNQKEQCYVDIGAFGNPTKTPYFHSNQ